MITLKIIPLMAAALIAQLLLLLLLLLLLSLHYAEVPTGIH